MKYEPLLHCEPGPSAVPSVESCDTALKTIPASTREMEFKTTATRFFDAASGKLPRDFYSSKLSMIHKVSRNPRSPIPLRPDFVSAHLS